MTEQTFSPALTKEQDAQLVRLKQYYPWRIVWGAIVNGEFESYATTTKHRMNKYLREGHQVFILN